MDSHELEVAKRLGGVIGAVVFSEKEKSLLYSLRSTGNLPMLLAFFHQFLVRYGDDIKLEGWTVEDLLSIIDNTNWFVYKSLIGIFSFLKYKKLESKKSDASKTQEVQQVASL